MTFRSISVLGLARSGSAAAELALAGVEVAIVERRAGQDLPGGGTDLALPLVRETRARGYDRERAGIGQRTDGVTDRLRGDLRIDAHQRGVAVHRAAGAADAHPVVGVLGQPAHPSSSRSLRAR